MSEHQIPSLIWNNWLDIFTYVSRHLVVVLHTSKSVDEVAGKSGIAAWDVQTHMHMGFLVEHSSGLHVATAAHCLKNNVWDPDTGRVRHATQLMYGFHDGTRNAKVFRIGYDEKRVVYHSDSGFDLAEFELKVPSTIALRSYGCEPIRIRPSPDHDGGYDVFASIGIPSCQWAQDERISHARLDIRVGSSFPMLPCKLVDDGSESLKMRCGGSVYQPISLTGHLQDENEDRVLSTLRGMSGGIHLGLRQEGDEVIYDLVGVVTHSDEKNKLLGVSPLSPFIT